MKNKLRYLFLLPLIIISCNPSNNKVTITLNPDGGTISKTQIVLDKGTVYYDGLFPTPTKDNYVFSYWSYPNNEDIPIDKTYTINNDATIKAQYVEAITVSFDTDGGDIMSPVIVGKGTIFKNSLFKTPTKLGYTFSYWTIDDKPIPDAYEINNDITLKAVYKDKGEVSTDEQYIKNMNINTLAPYLYSATCNEVDYSIANKLFSTDNVSIPTLGKAGCSSVYQNGFAGHNFDLNYSTIPEFIVKVTKTENRYASIGVAYDYFLNNSEVNTTKDMTSHKVLPFVTMDGINENGLFICMNEVPSKDKEVGRVVHTDSSKPRMNTINTIRYLLDNAKDVNHAKELMSQKDFFTTYGNELHYLVADKSGNSAVIEFKKSSSDESRSDIIFYELKASEYKGIMTNFTFNDYKGDAATYTNSDSSLTLHAEGVERYNILYNKMFVDESRKTLSTLDDVLDLLKNVYYTLTYTKLPTDKDFWFSEFNYTDSNTKLTTGNPDNYTNLLNGYLKYYKNKTRVNSTYGGFYNTRHSVAYDLNNQKLKLIFEENSDITFEASLID